MHVSEFGDEHEKQAKLEEIKALKKRLMELHVELGDQGTQAFGGKETPEEEEAEGHDTIGEALHQGGDIEGSEEEEEMETPEDEAKESSEKQAAEEAAGTEEHDPHGLRSFMKPKIGERRPGTAIMIAVGKPSAPSKSKFAKKGAY